MPRIRFIDRLGTERTVDADVDVSLVEVAIAHGIPGIAAECGGCCLCHTCHVRIGFDGMPAIPAPSDSELNMLDHMPESRYNSRLACRIFVTNALDGLVVRIP
ncbi:MAG: hypothetical protein RLZZ200_1378 [Pseudomonadota bacterium]|jgi:2Fe-2S ferredoxin